MPHHPQMAAGGGHAPQMVQMMGHPQAGAAGYYPTAAAYPGMPGHPGGGYFIVPAPAWQPSSAGQGSEAGDSKETILPDTTNNTSNQQQSIKAEVGAEEGVPKKEGGEPSTPDQPSAMGEESTPPIHPTTETASSSRSSNELLMERIEVSPTVIEPSLPLSPPNQFRSRSPTTASPQPVETPPQSTRPRPTRSRSRWM